MISFQIYFNRIFPLKLSISFQNDRLEREMNAAMTSAPDLLAPYLAHFTTKPNAMESLNIFEQCLNDIRIDYADRLGNLKQKLEEVSTTAKIKNSK